ncbi:MAG TPA: MMPL family transporter, partial [Patescibacteria group bacterium]|nr:MMPL family transporter [Patescibacteria group bacterium]
MERGNAVARAFGGFVARHHRWFLGGWLGVFLVMAFFSVGTPRLLSPSGFSADTEATKGAAILRQQFPDRRGPVLYAVFSAPAATIEDPAYQAQLAAWKADLTSAVAGANAVVVGPQAGKDPRMAALFVDSNDTADHFIELSRTLAGVSHPGPATVYLGGPGPVYNTFLVDSESDLRRSEAYSAPIAIVLLLLVFGGVVAGALPVITGLATVTAAIAVLGFVARFHTVSVFALNVSSVIGLGLGIDYSLLVTNRFREELRGGASVEQAVATTAGTAGVATVISGGTVMIGFGALLLARLNVLWSVGLGGVIVVAASVLASLTLIPALLSLFGSRVDRLALPFTRGRDTRRFWHALAGGVMRRPLVFIAIVVLAVLALASPARAFYPGVAGTESLPPNDPALTADRLLQAQFGAPAHSPTLVVAKGITTPAQASVLEAALKDIAAGESVVGPGDVPPVQFSEYLGGGYAVFEVSQAGGDNDRSTRALLDNLRAVPRPTGVSIVLTGEAPAYQDFLNVLLADFPKIFAVVLALTMVLLLISFRSIALPVKAVLMNLLSVGAAMGVLTWVFQEGHLSGLFNFTAVGFIDAIVPVVIFCGLFGLSMDYEVFLLSRIREEYLSGKSNTEAVAAGMERTGQIITSAALILVAVVGTLLLSSLTLNKALGVTFAAAILIDATLIRLLLVPAM